VAGVVTPGLTTATLLLFLLLRRRQVQTSRAIHQVLENVAAELRADNGPGAHDAQSQATQIQRNELSGKLRSWRTVPPVIIVIGTVMDVVRTVEPR